MGMLEFPLINGHHIKALSVLLTGGQTSAQASELAFSDALASHLGPLVRASEALD